MNERLKEISTQIAPSPIAVVICDGAGWHQRGKDLIVPDNIRLLSLPHRIPRQACLPASGMASWLSRTRARGLICRKWPRTSPIGFSSSEWVGAGASICRPCLMHLHGNPTRDGRLQSWRRQRATRPFVG